MCSVKYLVPSSLRTVVFFKLEIWALNGDALKQSPDRNCFTGDTENMGPFPQFMVKSFHRGFCIFPFLFYLLYVCFSKNVDSFC